MVFNKKGAEASKDIWNGFMQEEERRESQMSKTSVWKPAFAAHKEVEDLRETVELLMEYFGIEKVTHPEKTEIRKRAREDD